MTGYEPLPHIAVIGMAGRFPGAATVEQFWQNLSNGIESIIPLDDDTLRAAGVAADMWQHPDYVKAKGVLADADCFDAAFFGINPREAAFMDPQHRLFLECAWHALESAGYAPGPDHGRIGVYAGATLNTYLVHNLLSHPEHSGYQTVIGNDKDFLTTQVSYRLNLSGPGVTVQTACSTSLVAVHLACQSLLSWECDMALAGGISVTVPLAGGYLYQKEGIASPDGHCRVFDARAQGTVGGNGVGIVVLKRLSEATAAGDTILAVIRGSALNNDGARKVGYTAPSEDGQMEVITEALAMADVPAASISYVEAHGTGTVLGDPIEVAALARAFRLQTSARQFCALGAVKSNIGHLDAAAGVAGLIKTILALRQQQIPPTLHFNDPNPEIAFDDSPFYVNKKLRPWLVDAYPRRAGVSSFGIGGTNAHLIVEEAPPMPTTSSQETEQLILLSAKTDEALQQMRVNLAAHLHQHPDLNLADVAYTLQVGRRHFSRRLALVCHQATQAASMLATAVESSPQLTAITPDKPQTLAFMFPGQGSQYSGMGRDLYTQGGPFQEALDECAHLLRPFLNLNLPDILYPAETVDEAKVTTQLTQTAVAQPALFAVEYALARLWQAWGLKPVALIGHSIGEYVAACLAGVFSLADALAIVAHRGALMQRMPPGAMLSVALPETAVRAQLPTALSLAAVNRHDLCVVSGPEGAVAAFEDDLNQQKVSCHRLHTSHAFHSDMMAPMVAEFAAYVAQFPRQAPHIPILSNVTGTWLTAAEATDAYYWAEHVRQPVRFAAGIQKLMTDTEALLLETGPGRTLTTLVQPHAAVTTLRHPQEESTDTSFLLGALARLWLHGIPLDWAAAHVGKQRRRVPLPGYPFKRTRHWIAPQTAPILPTNNKGKQTDSRRWFYAPYWRPSPLPITSHSPVTWLLFIDDVAAEQALHTNLVAQGHQVVIISHCTTAADYQTAVHQAKPQRIVYWASAHFDLQGLLHLAQALDSITGAVHLDVITQQAQAVGPGNLVNLEQSGLLGIAPVIAQEYPQVTCRSIDVHVPESIELAAYAYGRVVHELQTPSPDPAVAYRGGQRWVPAFATLSSQENEAAPLRQGGVYLITGGFGRIGRALARHLAEVYQAQLILTGRTPLPPRIQWHQPHASDAVHDRIHFVGELEALGARVYPFTADVADVAQMQWVLAEVEQTVGALHGVIHTAAAVGPDTAVLLPDITPEIVKNQWRAKVQGARVLTQLLHDQELDFCVLFSSTSAWLGGLGFAAYAAANRYLDALAQVQAHQQRTPWLSINWDSWQFASAPHHTKWGQDLTELAMTETEGVQAFVHALGLRSLPQLIVSPGSWQPRYETWVMQPTGERTPSPSFIHQDRPQLQTLYVSPRNELEASLAGIWQALLGVKQVGIHDNFFDLGGHSLLATRLASEIQQAFGCELSLRQLFTASTVADMAITIAAQQLGDDIDEKELAALLQEVEQMPGEDLVQMTDT